jgi:hypothetical protein
MFLGILCEDIVTIEQNLLCNVSVANMPVVNDSTQDSMQDFYVRSEVFMAVTMKNIVF